MCSKSIFLPVLLMIAPAVADAGENSLRYRWADLGSKITGRKVSLSLPDGTSVSGKVLGVEADHLRMNIGSSSNLAVQPKGVASIPARLVSTLRMIERGKKWRVICTIAAPIVVGMSIAAATGGELCSGCSSGNGAAAGVLGSIAGGYWLGWVLDGRTVEIEIIR